jgi:hypothetical protein
MDKEFIEKLNSVSDWEKQDDNSELADNAISFHEDEDGLVSISGPKGKVVCRLKPLQELFSSKTAAPAVMKWDDPRHLHLLYTIEWAIKRVYMENPELTDSSVMLSLDQISMKPEVTSSDAVIKEISRKLRVALSMDDYSRDEVKKAARKILASVKRHKAAAGMRGYLDFIREHVP